MSESSKNEVDDQIHGEITPTPESEIPQGDVATDQQVVATEPGDESVEEAVIEEAPAENADDEEELAADLIVEDTKRNLNTDETLRRITNEQLETLCSRLIEDIVLKPQPEEANISMESEFIDGYLAFESSFAKTGIVKTPKHIAELMCDLAPLTENSKVLDITCGTGTFLSAAFQNIKGKIPPANVDNIKGNFAGFDTNAYMAGIAKNVTHLHGINHQNIRKTDCFSAEATAFAEEFQPDIMFLNPPHKTTEDQTHTALEFLKKACDMCREGGRVIALMPIANNTLVYTDQAKTPRKELLDHHRLLATMEMDPEIFKVVKTKGTSNPSAIVVMESHTPHQPTDEVWMAMWKRDGRRHKDKTGRIMDSRLIRRENRNDLWQDMRQQWTTAYRNQATIKLTEVPVKGREPLFGASHKRPLWWDDEENWNGDWIASAAIPPPESKGSTKQFKQHLEDSWVEFLRYSMHMKG